MPIAHAWFKLGGTIVMDPDMTAPLLKLGEVRVAGGSSLKQHLAIKSFCQGAVYQPDCMSNGFSPQCCWQAAHMQHCTDSLNQCLVQCSAMPFCAGVSWMVSQCMVPAAAKWYLPP